MADRNTRSFLEKQIPLLTLELRKMPKEDVRYRFRKEQLLEYQAELRTMRKSDTSFYVQQCES